ncbi:nuclease-related domain-containing protein [Salibacterium salarium]|uniref:nuclease-related domain-containing protein n=1 Tax=Salibacterium salarium TaxID=284579 RepID=UPI00163980DA|nr:nuclease-related domain-containing protein [Salibacterium salarium]
MLFQKLFKQKETGTETKSVQKKSKAASRKGVLAAAETELKKLPASFKTIRDVKLTHPDAASEDLQADYVVLSPYGIFIIKISQQEGVIRGMDDQHTWVIDEKGQIANPFLEMNQHIESLKHFIDSPDYRDYFISIVSFMNESIFETAPEFRKIVSNQLIVRDAELLEYIQRKIFVARFQYSTPLLDEKTMDSIYESLIYQNTKSSKVK